MKDGVQGNTHLPLFYSVIGFVVSIAMIVKRESNFSAWFLMSISIGYLTTYLEKKAGNRKQKMVFLILSYAVPVIALTYGLVFGLN